MAAVCGYAVWKGEKTERTVAVACVIAWLTTPLFEYHHIWRGADIGVLGVDLSLLAVLLYEAFTSNRWWPMAAGAFQIVNVALHLAATVDLHLKPRAYFVAMVICSDLVLIALAAGTLIEARRGRGFEGGAEAAGAS